ncbi:MAG TPA: disulfide bond formation protein B [Rhizobacter sp.]|nr:disulfide bond formation protein B [Rhizobacter sp.]
MTAALLKRPGLLLAAAALLSVAAVGAALVSQHVYGMEPCPWCILQRLIFLVIALVCLVGFMSTRIAGGLVLLLSLSGVAAALWQHFKAAASSSCAMTVADNIVMALKLDSLWPDVFLPRASCADAAVSMWGIPYDFYSLTLFVVLAATGWWVMRRR